MRFFVESLTGKRCPIAQDVTERAALGLLRRVAAHVEGARVHLLAKGDAYDAYYFVPGHTANALGSRPPKPTPAEPAAWWLDGMVRRNPPRTTPIDPVIVPPCVADPSPVTRRALGLIDAPLLVELLRFWSMEPGNRWRPTVDAAKRQKSKLKREAERWRKVASHLRAAITTACGSESYARSEYNGLRYVVADEPSTWNLALSSAEGKLLRTAPGVPDSLPARCIPGGGPGEPPRIVRPLDIVAMIARDADAIAQKNEGDNWISHIEERTSGTVVYTVETKQPFGARAWAEREAARSSKHVKAITRERVTVLDAALRAGGWTRPEIADLIIASQSDWNPRPVEVPPAYAYAPADIDSSDPATADRARKKRRALTDWISDRLR